MLESQSAPRGFDTPKETMSRMCAFHFLLLPVEVCVECGEDDRYRTCAD